MTTPLTSWVLLIDLAVERTTRREGGNNNPPSNVLCWAVDADRWTERTLSDVLLDTLANERMKAAKCTLASLFTYSSGQYVPDISHRADEPKVVAVNTTLLTLTCSIVLFVTYRIALRPILVKHNLVPLQSLQRTISDHFSGDGQVRLPDDDDDRERRHLEEGFRDDSDDEGETGGDERVRRERDGRHVEV
ncbi:hypothetical protein Q9L58_008595 [Maublancomyces gigas]|uniref:Uncharacterized protein n=1 Tax=Discina gigas TaxID=1032678 RepID=A0ABR3G9I9_9PEZI